MRDAEREIAVISDGTASLSGVILARYKTAAPVAKFIPPVVEGR
jgi:hypothetical protein